VVLYIGRGVAREKSHVLTKADSIKLEFAPKFHGTREECAQLVTTHDDGVVRAVVERQIVRPMYLQNVHVRVINIGTQ